MTSILGWVQFLRSGEYTEEELQDALHMIETSAQLQKRLIDDMLDVSRIILGKFQVDLRPIHLGRGWGPAVPPLVPTPPSGACASPPPATPPKEIWAEA